MICYLCYNHDTITIESNLASSMTCLPTFSNSMLMNFKMLLPRKHHNSRESDIRFNLHCNYSQNQSTHFLASKSGVTNSYHQIIRQSWGQDDDWTLNQFANIFSMMLGTNLFTKHKKQYFLSLLYQISAFTSILSCPSKCIFDLYSWMLIYTHTIWKRECILLAYPIELPMSRSINPSLRKK